MGRTLKIGIWVGAVLLGVGIAAKIFGFPLPFGPQTVGEYMQEVVDQGTLELVSKKVAAQYAGKQGDGFDSAGFEKDLDACLHHRIEDWLRGNDPRLADTITHDDVTKLAGEFTSACVKDLSAQLR